MRELAVFSRQFATLVASGMPMLRTLHTLEEQTQDEQIEEAVAGVRADVEAGSSLEQAMERHPKVFDRLFRAMVRSGEQSGRLEDVARPDRLPGRENRRPEAPGQIGADVPGAGLRLRRRRAGRDRRRSSIPVFVGIFEELGEENPEEDSRRCRCRPRSASTASDAITGYWFILIFRPSRLRFFALLQVEEDRTRERDLGSVHAAAPVQDRRRDPEGRAGPLVAHLLGLGLGRACRCCRRSN